MKLPQKMLSLKALMLSTLQFYVFELRVNSKKLYNRHPRLKQISCCQNSIYPTTGLFNRLLFRENNTCQNTNSQSSQNDV